MNRLIVLFLWGVLTLAAVVCGLEGVMINRQHKLLRTQRAKRDAAEKALANWRARRLAAEHDMTASPDATHPTAMGAAELAEAQRARDVADWLRRTKQLRGLFADHPEQAIPELQLLTELDWLAISREAEFDTEDDRRTAMAAARTRAKSAFAHDLSDVLKKFTAVNGGRFPASTGDLLPYFDHAIDAAMLARYDVTLSGRVSEVGPGRSVLVERDPIDIDYDSRVLVQARGGYSTSSPWQMSSIREAVLGAVDAFRTSHRGAQSINPADVTPYVNSTPGRAYIAALAEYHKAHGGVDPKSPEDILAYAPDANARVELEQFMRQRKTQK